jgi:alkylhydroperoxidase family enzyme
MARIEPIPWQDVPAAQQVEIEAGVASGALSVREPLQIFAYAQHDASRGHPDAHPQFPGSLLAARLVELLRIRSGQLGGCERCMASRKVASVTDADAECMVVSSSDPHFDAREQRALGFLGLLATDHHRIDDATYRSLGEVFTTAEIVELGMLCGQMIGMHRFLHTLDVFGDAPAVIAYDPGQVGVRIEEAGRPALGGLEGASRRGAER